MKKAFTLIELLVVIAIIAILAAILFPVFAQAKTAAKKTQDLSNQKNLNTGLQIYLSDADDNLPLLQYDMRVGANATWYPWTRVVHPYVKNGDLENDGVGGTANFGRGGIFQGPDWPARQQNAGSYAVSYGIFRDGAASWNGYNCDANCKTFSPTQIDGVADKIMMIGRGVNRARYSNWLQFTNWEWDWVDWLGGGVRNGGPVENPNVRHLSVEPWTAGTADCDYSASVDPSPPLDWASCSMLPRYRYNRSVNVTFLDGHAKSFVRSQNKTSIDWLKNIYIKEALYSWQNPAEYPY